MNKVFIIVGPSGCGKSTIVNRLKKNFGYYEHVSHTTRPIRPRETDGVNYNFVTEKEFDKINMLESVNYAGNYYGLSNDFFLANLNKHPISLVVTEINGSIAIKNNYPENTVIIFIKIDENFARKNMKKRGDNLNSILARIKYDREKDVYNDWIYADYVIDNDDKLQDVYDNIVEIIKIETEKSAA